MAGAVNAHREEDRGMRKVEQKQDLENQMCEMYHIASLYHDDVIDNADTR
jgi:geranylgeranyl pyrophosphate synthase